MVGVAFVVMWLLLGFSFAALIWWVVYLVRYLLGEQPKEDK